MSQDAKKELEAIKEQLHEKTADVSTYMQENERLWVDTVCLFSSVGYYLCIAILDFDFSALTLLVGRQEGHPACKKMEGWWRWALVRPDGVAPSWVVC